MRQMIKLCNSFLSFSIKTAGILLLLILTVNCAKKEPDFTVQGATSVTKDIKVNIAMIKDHETTIATVYYKGKSYAVDNEGVLRYSIYLSYQDRYFNTIEMDNLHYKLKGKPINEITIMKKGSTIMAAYRGNQEIKKVADIALLPADIFFAKADKQAVEKQKFITFYKK